MNICYFSILFVLALVKCMWANSNVSLSEPVCLQYNLFRFADEHSQLFVQPTTHATSKQWNSVDPYMTN